MDEVLGGRPTRPDPDHFRHRNIEVENRFGTKEPALEEEEEEEEGKAEEEEE